MQKQSEMIELNVCIIYSNVWVTQDYFCFDKLISFEVTALRITIRRSSLHIHINVLLKAVSAIKYTNLQLGRN